MGNGSACNTAGSQDEGLHADGWDFVASKVHSDEADPGVLSQGKSRGVHSMSLRAASDIARNQSLRKISMKMHAMCKDGGSFEEQALFSPADATECDPAEPTGGSSQSETSMNSSDWFQNGGAWGYSMRPTRMPLVEVPHYQAVPSQLCRRSRATRGIIIHGLPEPNEIVAPPTATLPSSNDASASSRPPAATRFPVVTVARDGDCPPVVTVARFLRSGDGAPVETKYDVADSTLTGSMAAKPGEFDWVLRTKTLPSDPATSLPGVATMTRALTVARLHAADSLPREGNMPSTSSALGQSASGATRFTAQMSRQHLPARAQVQLEGEWKDMLPEDFEQLCEHLAQGERQFTIRSRGQQYLIDFGGPHGATQTNAKTKKLRKLRILDGADIAEDADVGVAAESALVSQAGKKAKALRPQSRDHSEPLDVKPKARRPEPSPASRRWQKSATTTRIALSAAMGANGPALGESPSFDRLSSAPVPSKAPCRLASWERNSSCASLMEAPAAATRAVSEADAAVTKPGKPKAKLPIEVLTQRKLGPQSRRGDAPQFQLNTLEIFPHAQACFQQFSIHEQNFCGDFAVFYHSYSSAALIYEVHAAVASVLFRFKAHVSPLPRLVVHDFHQIPDASTLIDQFDRKFAHGMKDHDPEFRAVGLSVMCSLCSLGPEASPPVVFIGGYSMGYDMSFKVVLDNLLEACHVPKADVKDVAGKVITLCEKYGLDVSQYGGKACPSQKSGHLLQIFIRRKLLDQLVYAAEPWGYQDSDRHPISTWLNADSNTSWGQARIVAHPKFFMSSNSVRMFVASAEPSFHENRPAFQAELCSLLGSIIGDPVVRTRAATAIYGGTLPSWWSDEDHTK